MLQNSHLTVKGVGPNHQPKCIPIKINNDFLELIRKGSEMSISFANGHPEINVNDGVIALKSMGTAGENEIIYRENEGVLDFVGFSGVKVSMPPKVNRSRLKQIGKEEKAAKDERKSILLDDFEISKKKSTLRSRKSILPQNHSIKHTRTLPQVNNSSPVAMGGNSTPLPKTHASQAKNSSLVTAKTPSSNGLAKTPSTPIMESFARNSANAPMVASPVVASPANNTTPASNFVSNGAGQTKGNIKANEAFFKSLSIPVDSKNVHSRTASDSGLPFRKALSDVTDTLKVELIHYLACAPHEIKDCCSKTGSSEKNIIEILKEIGTPQASNPNYFQLRSEFFKAVRPWEWKEYSKTERERVIKNASIAFDFLKLPKDAMERKNLSPSGGKRKGTEVEGQIKKLKAGSLEDVNIEGAQKVKLDDSLKTNISVKMDGPVKIDRIKLKAGSIKPASTLKSDSSDKVLVSPDSEIKNGDSDQSLKRKNDDNSHIREKKGKFEGAKADRMKHIQTSSADAPLSETKLSERLHKRLSRGKPIILTQDRKDWDLMSKVELEYYSSWLVSQKLYLQGKVDLVQKIAKNLSLNLLGKEKESERMSLIRSNLKVKGFSTDPGLFLAQAKANVKLFNIISKELAEFEEYIIDCGGKFEYEIN